MKIYIKIKDVHQAMEKFIRPTKAGAVAAKKLGIELLSMAIKEKGKK